MKTPMAVSVLALAMAQSALAAPVEQVACVYNGVGKEVRDTIDLETVEREQFGSFQTAMETALAKCMTDYDWTDADSENGTRYFLMRSIAENAEKALPLGHAKIVQSYFADNEAKFTGAGDFLANNPDAIINDLTKRGIPAVKKKQEDAALYLYWLVQAKQLQADFVAGTLRKEYN
jgi:hypothetical protein